MITKAVSMKLMADRGNSTRLEQVHRTTFLGAKENHCIENSLNYVRHVQDAYMVIGWCVGEYKHNWGSAIIPHCWVVDKSGSHLDVTPLPMNANKEFDYVSDDDVADLYLDENKWLLSLRMTTDDRYQIRLAPGVFHDIPDVKTDTLKQYCQKTI